MFDDTHRVGVVAPVARSARHRAFVEREPRHIARFLARNEMTRLQFFAPQVVPAPVPHARANVSCNGVRGRAQCCRTAAAAVLLPTANTPCCGGTARDICVRGWNSAAAAARPLGLSPDDQVSPRQQAWMCVPRGLMARVQRRPFTQAVAIRMLPTHPVSALETSAQPGGMISVVVVVGSVVVVVPRLHRETRSRSELVLLPAGFQYRVSVLCL